MISGKFKNTLRMTQITLWLCASKEISIIL